MTGLAEVYSDANAGSGKALNVSTYVVNDGNSGHNYNISTTPNFTAINAATPGVSASATPNPVTYGNQVALGATISGPVGGATPSGSVQFYQKNVAVGSPVILVNGSASLNITETAVTSGNVTVKAQYISNGPNYSNASGTTSLTVKKNNSTLSTIN